MIEHTSEAMLPLLSVRLQFGRGAHEPLPRDSPCQADVRGPGVGDQSQLQRPRVCETETHTCTLVCVTQAGLKQFARS